MTKRWGKREKKKAEPNEAAPSSVGIVHSLSAQPTQTRQCPGSARARARFQQLGPSRTTRPRERMPATQPPVRPIAPLDRLGSPQIRLVTLFVPSVIVSAFDLLLCCSCWLAGHTTREGRPLPSSRFAYTSPPSPNPNPTQFPPCRLHALATTKP